MWSRATIEMIEKAIWTCSGVAVKSEIALNMWIPEAKAKAPSSQVYPPHAPESPPNLEGGVNPTSMTTMMETRTRQETDGGDPDPMVQPGQPTEPSGIEALSSDSGAGRTSAGK